MWDRTLMIVYVVAVVSTAASTRSLTANKCDKCNVPVANGGCKCNINCDCIQDPCTKCNLPASQGGCKCDNNCNCIVPGCTVSGYLTGVAGHCNTDNGAECCEAGQWYKQYTCSPPVTSSTPAILTLNSFAQGGDGGGASACTGKFYSDSQPVAALSTGWYSKGSRCGKTIIISANGRSTTATVVDECDSVNGCDSEHDYQPPCPNNVVDVSKAVWQALGISSGSNNWGYMPVTWRDA